MEGVLLECLIRTLLASFVFFLFQPFFLDLISVTESPSMKLSPNYEIVSVPLKF